MVGAMLDSLPYVIINLINYDPILFGNQITSLGHPRSVSILVDTW